MTKHHYQQPALWCQACGECLLLEVRRVRKELGLTQKEAGLLPGGGRNAFQKYESAEALRPQP